MFNLKLDTAEESFAPHAFILLPIAMAMHIAEEWYGGFVDWASFAINVEIDPAQFLSVNLVGLILVTIGAVFAYRVASAAWIGIALAALFFVNTVLHTGLSIAVGTYSPGMITGLLFYVPLSIIIFRWAIAHLSHGVVGGAILFGIGFHAIATLSAVL